MSYGLFDVPAERKEAELKIVNPEQLNVLEMLRENLAPGETLDVFSLPRLRVPVGGTTTWELPDGQRVESIRAVIIHRQLVRAYWPTAYSGGGQPPACTSLDSITGFGNPGGQCATCRFAQWGSATTADGRPRAGQACKQITRLFLLLERSILPWLLPLPPTSGKAAREYAVSVTAMGLPLWHVITELSLRRVTSRDGLPFSQVVFQSVGRVSPEQIEYLNGYRQALKPFLTGIPVSIEEAQEETQEETQEAQIE